MLMNALGARGSSSGFSVFVVLELAHTAESASKRKTYDFNF